MRNYRPTFWFVPISMWCQNLCSFHRSNSISVRIWPSPHRVHHSWKFTVSSMTCKKKIVFFFYQFNLRLPTITRSSNTSVNKRWLDKYSKECKCNFENEFELFFGKQTCNIQLVIADKVLFIHRTVCFRLVFFFLAYFTLLKVYCLAKTN